MTEVLVSITSCLDETKRAFHDGAAILDKIKRKRALKRAPPPPRLLEESIDQAPDEIEKEKQRGLARFGKAFQLGDQLAIIQLQHVTIQLQASLLEKLRNAAFDDDHAITDFTYLVDAADGGRDRTIAVLHDFKQRLLHGTSRDDFHSPNSSNSNLGLQTPGQTPAHTPASGPPPKSPSERVLSQPPTSRPIEGVKRLPTQSRDFSPSGSDDGDATSGADDIHGSPRPGHKKRNSLLQFLKHTRTNSSTEKSAPHNTIMEEPARSRNTSALTTALAVRSAAGEQPAPTSKPAPTSNPSPPTSRDRSATAPSHPTNNSRGARYTYEDWEDNPSEIWGARPDSRETTALAPHAQRGGDDENPLNNLNRQLSNTSSLRPPSPILMNRTNSMAPSFASFGGGLAAGLGAPSSSSYLAVPGQQQIVQPNPDNDFLGFCKSAWKLQNGDRKGSFAAHKQVEPWSRHPGAYAAAASYLACSATKCAFRSNFIHVDVEVIWNKCFTIQAKGLKFRWRFLAKSHVLQKVVVKCNYSFKCLFCVFQGAAQGGGGVYHGIDYYLDHINEHHRGQRMNEVVLYKTGCVIDRIADDGEDFDINLFPGASIPVTNTAESERKGSEWLSDDLLTADPCKEGRDDSMFSANEPWNEGLSDFSYRGKYDRTELE